MVGGVWRQVLLREDLLESGVVSAQLFGRLTAEHDGLYELFQHAADPGEGAAGRARLLLLLS